MIQKPLTAYPARHYDEGIRLAAVDVRRNHPRALHPAIKSSHLPNNLLPVREAQAKRDAAKKAKEDKVFTDAIGKVKWPLSEKHLNLLFKIIIDTDDDYEFGKIARPFGIEGVEKKERGYSNTQYAAVVKKHFEALGNAGKLQLVVAFLIGDKVFGDKETKNTLAAL